MKSFADDPISRPGGRSSPASEVPETPPTSPPSKPPYQPPVLERLGPWQAFTLQQSVPIFP